MNQQNHIEQTPAIVDVLNAMHEGDRILINDIEPALTLTEKVWVAEPGYYWYQFHSGDAVYHMSLEPDHTGKITLIDDNFDKYIIQRIAHPHGSKHLLSDTRAKHILNSTQ